MNEYGQYVEKDLKKAVGLFAQAAEKGHPIAQYSLGFLYEHGQGSVILNFLANNLYRPPGKEISDLVGFYMIVK